MTTLQAVELGVLGPLQARQGGAPVAIPGAKPRAILTMLGLHSGSVVSADTFLELLWGDDPPRTAAKALQTHISALRRTLGDGVVLTLGTGWTLADAEVDASRYKIAARIGRDAAANGDTAAAVGGFEEALALWRGIPELPDSHRGSSEKTRWIEAHAALVEDRADALLATGRAAEIVGELEAAVADAPLRERRWGQLMLALYRAGRQGEALGAYQRARAMLADQLGVDPGPELRRLEAAIVAQDSALDTPVAQQASSLTKAVTFLLTDIEGSTAAWESDADSMAVALARHDELVEVVVTSRGGRLIKTRGEGDATFSVFDRPSAAAAAALELQEAVIHEPWPLAEPLRVRVALHTGEVELRDGDYFGRAVNRAARLRSLASGGQILCSGATAELVIDSLSDDVVLVDLGVRQLRNLARPEHVFELRMQTEGDEEPRSGSDAPIQRPDVPAMLTGHGPFVGRGEELQRLSSTWQHALLGGMRAVLIAGEPGVGKTRLAGEWSQQAYAQEAVVLYGRCDEDLGAPYQPFAEALRSLVPCLSASRLRGLRGVEALLPLVPGLADVLPDLAAPTRADPETERYALFDAVVALLESASAGAPVVLILDDLHWAAKSTLLLLRHLLRFGDQARVQIVGTYRSTDLDRSHPLAAMLADLHRDGTAERLQLGGLDQDDVTTYVAEAGYDDEELGRALASVTGGNPFFLIEALRHVDESGGVWDQSTLPQGVREAVSRRLSRLAAETNKALAAAAVVGSRFAVDLVERVVDQDLVDAFDEACKAGIVIEEPGGRYRFNHALIRQSLLAELPSVRRMRLHQRIATTLENESGAGDDLLAELAHHYFECAWAGNAAKAVEYCRRAADQAMARLAYEGAADLYDHALHALEEIDDELPDRDDLTTELLVARCEALLAAGDVVSAAGAVTQLQQATHDSARIAAWAACYDGQLSMLVHPERLDLVESTVSAAADTLAELDDAAGEAKANTVRALCLGRLGRIGDSEIALDRALTAARSAREHRRVNAVLAVAPLAALWGPNPVPRAGGRCLDVVRLLRITTDSPAVEATSTRCQAVLEAFRGRGAAARRMIESARRTVNELGLRHAVLEVEQFAGIVELVVDDPAAAEQHLRKAYNGFRRLGLDADTAETAALLGRACLALDREAEADQLCSESERLAGHALKASIAWRTLRAHLASRRGEHGEARRAAEDAIALAERTDALVDHGDACLTLAVVLNAAGDAAGARVAAERAVDLYERKGATALADRASRVLDSNDLVAHQTSSNLADLNEAITDLDTPYSRPEGPGPHVREPQNEATRVGIRYGAAFAAQDWTAVTALLSESFVIDDRRPTVNGGIRRGRGAEIEDLQAAVAVGFTEAGGTVIATRGERLSLARARFSAGEDNPFETEVVNLIEIDTDGRVAAVVIFASDDITAAFEELDTRYLAGEAAPFADTWRPIAQAYVALNHHRLPTLAADWVDVDHRALAAIGPNDLVAYIDAAWDDMSTVGGLRIEAVHRLSGLGAVVTHTADGVSRVGVNAEWRMVCVFTVADDVLNRLEIFDETDLDEALARFDEMHATKPRLENAATKAHLHASRLFEKQEWTAMAETLAPDICDDDRRRITSSGLLRGSGHIMMNSKNAAALGLTHIAIDVIATRGDRLALSHLTYHGDQGPEALSIEVLSVIEIGLDGRCIAYVAFDPEDFDAAYHELDERYLVGEAAVHSDSWTTISHSFAALNQREIPPTTGTFGSIDHRKSAAYAPDDLPAYVRAGWELDQKITTRIESVHRLDDHGAVVTHAADGTSPDGFDAEWRGVDVLIVDGNVVSRAELFDEDDLEAALARFDELCHCAPTHLNNAAVEAWRRAVAAFNRRDWDAIPGLFASNYYNDDRRRVVNAGIRRGRDAAFEDLRVSAEVGLITTITAPVVAVRGERLLLTHFRAKGENSAEYDVLLLVECDAARRFEAAVMFDPDDFDGAFNELEARYTAGEAAAHAHTWSLVADGFARFNRHELPDPRTRWADHRRLVGHGPSDQAGTIPTAWDLTRNVRSYAECVHRLSDRGAIVTSVASGTSHEGFDFELRIIDVFTVDGDRIDRCEMFDESDFDTALARFEGLSADARSLGNAASQAYNRLQTMFTDRDWDAMSQLLAEGICTDDRRRVVNAGIRQGRDAVLTELSSFADIGARTIASEIIATRGDRLALHRSEIADFNGKPGTFDTKVLDIIEVDQDERIVARVVFDQDDISPALAELDARFSVAEGAAHAGTYRIVAGVYADFNEGEVPKTTADWVNVDRRRTTKFAPGDLVEFLRAAGELEQGFHAYIEQVHLVTEQGAAVTRVCTSTSSDGFDAEWRSIDVMTVDGDLVSRFEIFDDSDIDVALARFDGLNKQTRPLANTASNAYKRLREMFALRDWGAMSDLLAENVHTDDRRRVINSGIREGTDAVLSEVRSFADIGAKTIVSDVVATRGDRLALHRARIDEIDGDSDQFDTSVLTIVETDADKRILARTVFDLHEMDAAIIELDGRYLAGEAAAHADTWSAITRGYAALNRHELGPTAAGWASVDHRRAVAFSPGDLPAYLRAGREITPDGRIDIEAVHQLNSSGAVLTHTIKGTSQHGFDAEWREVCIVMITDAALSRLELFDEGDLEAALGRFDELQLTAP